MRRKGSYFLVTILLFVCVAAGGAAGYFCAWSHMEQRQAAFEKKIDKQIVADIDTKAAKTATAAAKKVIEQELESIQTNAGSDALSIDTVYQIQKYNALTKQTVTEYETLPEELVGLSREDVDEYCKKYMNRMPVQEYLDGLQSLGVVSFSQERLVVKKIYDSSKVKYRYYLIAVDGEVVAYYGDKSTVYEYTGIETKNLTQQERKQLKKGVEVKDENELYSILENYSS